MLKAVVRATYCCGAHVRVLTSKINPITNGSGLFKLQNQCTFNQISNVTSSALLRSKEYVETENRFAHEIMERSDLYSTSLAPKSRVDFDAVSGEEFTKILANDWSDNTASAVYKDFKRISDFASKNKRNITESVFDGLCKAVVANQADFTDEELAGILQGLLQWPETTGLNSRNFSDVWSAIDRQCVARVRTWDNKTLLYFADHWYHLHLLRVTKFMWHCIRKLTQKPKKLTQSNLVQCMFYINACRKMNPAISLFELEFHIEQFIEQLTVDELAIVAMGFFKTQTPIRNPKICVQMIHMATKEANTISDITLCALVKAIRFSVPLSHADMLMNMLDKLVPNVDRLSLLCCVHLALTGTNSQMFHRGILKAVSQKLVANVQQLRLKDLERVTFALSMFDFDPKTAPCIFSAVASELRNPRRADEMRKFPRSLVSALHYLTLRGNFHDDLLSHALDPDFITAAYGSHHTKVARDVLCLDVNVEVERPNYRGNRLPAATRRALATNFAAWSSPVGRSLSAADRLTLELAEHLEALLGNRDLIFVGNLLPNSPRPDIVVAIDNAGLALPIDASFRDSEPGVVKRAPPEPRQATWRCLVVGGWNSYIRDTERPVGTMVTKLRQLRLIGYQPKVIPWFEWMKVSVSDREAYLHKKLMLPQ